MDVEPGDGGFTLRAERGEDAVVVRARTIVLATGARERFLPFPGWTLPGVVGVGGAQALLKSGVSFAGRRAVVAGSGPLLLPVAASLAKSGARVSLVAEQAPTRALAGFALGLWRRPASLVEAARYRVAFAGAPYRAGAWVTAARGDGALREVDVKQGGSARTIACDLLCTGLGLVPNTELARMLGCATRDGFVVVDAMQSTSVAGVYCAGEPTGIGGEPLASVEGTIAGRAAAGDADGARASMPARDRLRPMVHALARAFALRDDLLHLATADTIVCRCEDVTLGAIDPAWSPRQAKLYTRAGMGPCQGRVCGAALECLSGWPTSTDAVRPPAAPARLSTLRSS